MKRLFTICTALAASLLATHDGAAAPPEYPAGTLAAYFDDAPEPAAVDDVAEEIHEEPAEESTSSCGCESEASDCASGCGEEASCCCEPSCGCSNGCGSGCCGDDWCVLGVENCWPFSCCCDYGDACTLKSHLTPCCDINYGGWFSIGYYTDNDPLSFDDNDLFSFWDNPNELNFDQQWFYLEKLADGECNWDVGYRFDLVYGVDAQKTQAFGNSGAGTAEGPQGYDNGWDHGKYGWAAPQAYVQLKKGDLDIKVGHFFTPLGYEVIPKTGNFFYSHSYTMFNSEPFTHTGALATYAANDTITYYFGWTLGWDTGYDQFGDGNNFIGGAAFQLADDVKYTYLCTAGDLGWRGDGYSHSNVVDFTLSDKWQYVFQSDLLTTDANSQAFPDAYSVGANNYVFYTINDCWKWGTRAEWWRSNQLTGEATSYYAVTTGLNYQASANLIIRPEVKWNWTPTEESVENVIGEEFDNTIFGIDAIYTF
jgi:hypothetical protein